MTYFLDKWDEPPKVQGRAPPTDVTSFSEGVGAAFGRIGIETNQNFYGERVTREATIEAAREAINVMGPERVRAALVEEGMWPEMNRAFDVRHLRYNTRALRHIMDMARTDAEQNPDRWSGVRISDEAIIEQANERLQAEWQDYQDALTMMPSGRGMAELLGGVAATTLDIKNLPFLLFGGGSGSFAKVMARGAAINVAAEAAFLPDQFEMAERLNIPEPDVRAQLAMAALGGAAFEGVVEGIGRGITYWRSRSTGNPRLDAAIDATEEMIDHPAVLSPEPEVPQAFLRDEDIAAAAELGVDPETVWDRMTPEAREPFLEETPEVQAARENLNRALKEMPAAGRRRPFTSALKARGYKIDPDGEIGQELKAAGITNRTAPGLFRSGGYRDLDNLDPDTFDAFRDAIGVEGNYLSRQGVIDAIINERAGVRTPMRGAEDVYDAERMLAEAQEAMRRGTTPDEAPRPDQPYVLTPAEEAFDQAADNAGRIQRVEATVDEYLDRPGMAFTPDERQSMIDMLNESGGYVEDAAEVVATRMAREADAEARGGVDAEDDIPFGEAGGDVRPDEADFGGRVGAEGGAAEGGAGDAPRRNAGGEQAVIPGTERVDTGAAQRARQEMAAIQQQSMIRRGDQTRVEDDPDTLFAPAQMDAFDDVTTREAEEFRDAVTADIQDRIEAEGDFEVLDEDGNKVMASDLLEDLDKDREFVEVIDLCGRPT